MGSGGSKKPAVDTNKNAGGQKEKTTPVTKGNNSDAKQSPAAEASVLEAPPSSPPHNTTGGTAEKLNQKKTETEPETKGDKSADNATDKDKGDQNVEVKTDNQTESETKGDNTGSKENSTSEYKKEQTEEKPAENDTEQTDKGTEDTATGAEESKKEVKKIEIEERVIPPEPEDQRKFDDALSSACLLVKPDSLLKKLNVQNVTRLSLKRSLPLTFKLHDLLVKLTNLQDLDLSNNNMGPQAFRSICLAMCNNSTILSLNLADNKTDTDSAMCLGRMLTHNKTLVCLNVSNNYLGKDYFSRCCGPPLKTNTSLQTLRAQNIGSVDMDLIMEGLKENSVMVEVDFSANCMTDATSYAKGFAQMLKRPDCSLETLALANCEIGEAGIEILRDGLQHNSSMVALNLNANTFGSLTNLLKFVVTAACHPNMSTLSVDNAKVTDTSCKSDDCKDCVRADTTPNLQVLSLNNSQLTDNFLSSLATLLKGRQLPLVDIDVGANDITSACLQHIAEMTSAEGCPSMLRKLKYNLITNGNGLSEQLTSGLFPSLHYLNVRKSKLTNPSLLADLYKGQGCFTTLIIDGQKIANTDVLATLLDNSMNGSLTTLSVGGCSLSPTDITPLCQAIRKGLKLQMLKVSGNRLEDKGVIDLIEAFLSNKTHPLAVLDVSSNLMTNESAVFLTKLFTTKNHKSVLHSVNVSSNNIGKAGIESLVSVIGGKSPLRSLYLQNQTNGLDEPEMDEIFKTLTKSLGYKVQMKDDEYVRGCSDLPNLPEGLIVKLSPLGGNPGKLGNMVDSTRIITDSPLEKLPYLSLADVNVISAFLKGAGSDVCVWSGEEWNMITGADRPTTETPSWLQVASSRDVVVYLCNLPGNTTRQKVEAMLEMEADCNLDEVCLMKDPVTRSINGVGWALLVDQESVNKALEYFQSGMAKIFGQAFIISPLKVKVDDEANAANEAEARKEQEKRLKLKQQEDRDHRRLIQRTTEETWKRHEYRLAHPAYADGRIW